MKRRAWHIDAGFVLMTVALFAGLQWLAAKQPPAAKNETPWIILRDGDLVDGKPACTDGQPGRDWKCPTGRRL